MSDPFLTNRLPQTVELSIEEKTQKDHLVLVAEDFADSAIPISLHLQQNGYRVLTASDGEEAVKATSISRPDVILMDIAMPVLDGLGAARIIRADSSLPYIPIIAITAFNTGGFLQAAYDVGFDGYLTKPIDFDRMVDLIKSLLARR